MGSLSDLLKTELTVPAVIEKIKSLLQQNSSGQIETALISEEEAIFKKRFEQMVKRNANLAEIE